MIVTEGICNDTCIRARVYRVCMYLVTGDLGQVMFHVKHRKGKDGIRWL